MMWEGVANHPIWAGRHLRQPRKTGAIAASSPFAGARTQGFSPCYSRRRHRLEIMCFHDGNSGGAPGRLAPLSLSESPGVAPARRAQPGADRRTRDLKCAIARGWASQSARATSAAQPCPSSPNTICPLGRRRQGAQRTSTACPPVVGLSNTARQTSAGGRAPARIPRASRAARRPRGSRPLAPAAGHVPPAGVDDIAGISSRSSVSNRPPIRHTSLGADEVHGRFSPHRRSRNHLWRRTPRPPA